MEDLLTTAEIASAPVMGTVTVCKHCRKRPVCYDRGYCHRCHDLTQPTEAMPGTTDKIEIMRERAEERLPLFVRGDYDPKVTVAGDER